MLNGLFPNNARISRPIFLFLKGQTEVHEVKGANKAYFLYCFALLTLINSALWRTLCESTVLGPLLSLFRVGAKALATPPRNRNPTLLINWGT